MKSQYQNWVLAAVAMIMLLPACSLRLAGEQPNATATPIPTRQATSLPALVQSTGLPGTFEPSACRFALPDDPTLNHRLQEGVGVECGYLLAPEDHNHLQGRTIRLAVAIFHRPGGAIYPDPVIYLSGGPGVGILEVMRYQYEAMSEVVFAAGRDLIIFDQRGVGLSRPALDCPEYTDLALDLLDQQVNEQMVDDQQAVELILESMRACRETLSQAADLSKYNSIASAEDIELMRQALGLAEVNLWGGSYGTRLGLEVLRLHPEHLRSVTLEAVYPPDVDLVVSSLGNFSRSLELLFTRCAADPTCSQSYPDLRSVFFATVERLDAEPVMVQLMDPFSGEEYPANLDGSTLLALIFQALYDSDLRYLLPKLIYDANQGDFTVIERFRSSLIYTMKLNSRGMMFSVQCYEEIPFSSPQAFFLELARYPELAGMYRTSAMGPLTFEICQFWNIEAADASANRPVSSDRPVLILNGEFDPITPPTWGMQAAQTLSNAYTFTYPGIGHGAILVDDCPAGMFTAFLLDPTHSPDASCIAEMER